MSAANDKEDRRSRYRVEDGEPCIDVATKNIERLLDTRDPAPFRDRDLDPALVDYLLEAADDLASQRKRLRVIFWLAEPCAPNEVESAYRGHFEDAQQSVARKNRQRLRMGASAGLIAVLLLVAFFTLSQFMRSMEGAVWGALAEGLLILAWIVLWRPVEVLLYDWIPFWQERKTLERLLAAKVEVRAGARPTRHPSGVWSIQPDQLPSLPR